MVENLKKLLVDNNITISVAESCTAGKLQDLLTSISGSSEYFEGGMTAYNINQKVKHLGVDYDHAKEVDCISPLVAKQMAIGATKLFETRLSVSTTGYIQSHLFYCIYFDGEVLSEGNLDLSMYSNRNEAKTYAPVSILSILYKELVKSLL